MPEKYRIRPVKPEWALEPEDMGTKEKFWYREPRDPVDWLFKRPRPGTGENWGMLRSRVGELEQGWLAPSFDHASSLGRELLDERRSLLLREKRVGAYSTKGRGQIYWSEEARHPPSPLELVRMAVVRHPSHFDPALEDLAGLRGSRLTEIVDRIPDDWMSAQAREFAVNLMTCNRKQLMELRK